MKRKIKKPEYSQALGWLPIDSRLFMPLFQFGRVKGIARMFLEVELLLAMLVVLGTLTVAGITVVQAVVR